MGKKYFPGIPGTEIQQCNVQRICPQFFPIPRFGNWESQTLGNPGNRKNTLKKPIPSSWEKSVPGIFPSQDFPARTFLPISKKIIIHVIFSILFFTSFPVILTIIIQIPEVMMIVDKRGKKISAMIIQKTMHCTHTLMM